MSQPDTTSGTRPGCIFCAIVAGRAESSTVYADDVVVAFMSLHPVTTGHLVVVPRRHATGLGDLDADTAAHAMRVAQRLARALRESSLPCEGINLFVCDGAVAWQSVFHFHLHVIPRSTGDSWDIHPEDGPARERGLLDADAAAIRAALG